jgi:hypothetical protein
MGAYGLRIDGLPGATAWMQPQAPEAPGVRVEAEVGPSDGSPSRFDADAADIALLGGGRLQCRRGTGVVRYLLPRIPPDEDLLHPYLAPGAALLWQWAGVESLHGGAFAFAGDRGAFLLLGGKEAGKSTTLAWLAEHAQASVLADDLAVLQDNEVLAGPRSIDLRAAPGSRGFTTPLWPVRDGERNRLTLAPVPGRVPLAAVIVLQWRPKVTLTRISPGDRMTLIGAQRMYRGPWANAPAILDVAALPAFYLGRPRNLESLADVAEVLADSAP